MPELPEVETIRRQLAPTLGGAAITHAWSTTNPKFTPAIGAVGHRIDALDRRGKYLIARLDHTHDLLVHLGMTGKLRIDHTAPDPALSPHLRAWWHLDDGRALLFDDVRQFGRISVTPRGDYSSLGTLSTIGPEPWDPTLTDRAFWQALRSTRRHIKTDLLSQRPIAGVGNIYADEALWRAGVHPADRTISQARATALLSELRHVLAEGIAHGGTTLRDYVDAEGSTGEHQHHLACYGRGGQPCERCTSTLLRGVLDGRGTTWCPSCQPRRR